MNKIVLSNRLTYSLAGLFFGVLFPCFSWILDASLNEMELNWATIIQIHKKNVAHFVVDFAPLVLGLSGLLLGRTNQRKFDMQDRLMKVNQSLDNFTFRITHDLRSPALNIRGLADILVQRQDDIGPEERRELLDKLELSVAKWLSTFEDFVELLKEEKSGVKVRKNFNLNAILKDVLDQLTLEIENSGAKVVVDFSQCKTVRSSKSDLMSIFMNLISNAIKYAHPDRRPEIHIQSVRSQSEAIIVVEDNGMGMDMDKDRGRLFKLFSRLDNTENIDGTGVGLYLVKGQIEQNGGKIDVASTLGKGTTFTITLPLGSSRIKRAL